MFSKLEYFVPGTIRPCYKVIRCADGKTLNAYLTGTVILTRDPSLPATGDNAIICENSLFVEGLSRSLISVPQLDHIYKFSFTDNTCTIKTPILNRGKRATIYTLQKASNTDNLYHLPFYTMSEMEESSEGQICTNLATVDQMDIDTAHIIWNHASDEVLYTLYPHLKGKRHSFCHACALAGLKNKPYTKKANTLSELKDIKIYVPRTARAPDGDIEHTELHDDTRESAAIAVDTEVRMNRKAITQPFTEMSADAFTSPKTSVRGIKYVFVLVDTVTKVCYPFLTRTKDEFKNEYVTWSKHIYNKTGRFPAYIRVDQGGELTSHDMEEYFNMCGTKLSSSTTKQSNQNAFAERLIGVLWRKTKIALTQCGLPLTYWCYAFAYVAIVYNHMPHRSLNNRRPVDVAGLTPVDNLLRPLGSESYYYKPIESKGDLTGHRSLFLGFDNVKRGYFFLDLTTKKVVSSRTAISRYRSFPMLQANNGIPLPHDIIGWPTPTTIRSQQEKGGIVSLPPNTVSIKPNSVKDLEVVWDNLADPTVNQPFMKSLSTLPPTKTKSNSKIVNWIKTKLTPSINIPSPAPNSAPQMISPILPNSTSKDTIEPPFFPTVSKSTTNTSETTAPLTEHMIGDKPAYEVEGILKHKKAGRGLRMLVKWKGYEEPTWEPKTNLQGCDDLVQKYFSSLDIKKSLIDDFENTTALDTDSVTKQRVHQLLKPMQPFKTPKDPPRRSARLNPNISPIPEGDELELQGQDTQEDKPSSLTTPNEPGTAPNIAIPVFPSTTDTATSDKITIGETISANLTATEVPLPPDYSSHEMFTPANINLDEIISYAFHTKDGKDLFDTILKKEAASFEQPPPTQPQMLKGKRVKEFVEAEERELLGIIKHGTWEIVVRPKGRTPITCRWVYDIKRDSNNEITLFKARLVVHGFKQVEGVDFTKTFSSTAQMRSFRTIVMLAVAFNLDLNQYDISNAFLNGDLEEEIYMEYPPGYPGEEGTCLKLLKGLYGLKQAARIWNKALIKVLNQAGMKVCKTEPGILYHPTELCLVCLHVDDIIIATNNRALQKKIEDLLNENFLVKNLGKLHQFVGIEIVRDKDRITLKQTAYADRVWSRFQKWLKVFQRKTTDKSPNFSEKLSKFDVPAESTDDVLEYPFPSVVGSLMYLVTATRPDMLHSVVQLARFMAGWGETHIDAANKAIKYLSRTKSDGIVYTRPPNFSGKLKIMCFSDSDWAGCPDTRRSTLWYTIMVCGGPISWKSQLRKTLAHSSCEAEYMALSEVGREIIWLCNFLDEIGVEYETPQLFCDSSSAINWSEDPIQHQRTKHVELDYYYIREIVAEQKVKLYKIHTKENVSDLFTKNVDGKTFAYLKPFLMGWKQIKLEQ